MTVRLLLLDIAGTVVESGNFTPVFRGVYREILGVDVSDEEIRVNTGRKKADVFAEVVRRHAPRRTGEAGVLGDMVAAFDRRMIERLGTDPPAILPGVPRALRRARDAGVLVGYVTGFAREPADRLLGAVGLDRDVLVGTDEVERGRPAPDLIREAMARLGVDEPALVAYAGDTPGDVLSGLNAGCSRVYGLTCGAHSRGELEAASEDPRVRIVDALAEAVDDLFGR
ncbi:MAG: HAD family hydrolase [Planctomycetota bacterium]